MRVPKKGDIIHLSFDPASGTEMKGDYYALVVSDEVFNDLGLAYVCPISQENANSARNLGFIVSLQGSGTHTSGSIHCHQLKSLDWKTRNATYKESVPSFIINDVLLRIDSILNGD